MELNPSDPLETFAAQAGRLRELNRSCLCLPIERAELDAQLIAGVRSRELRTLLDERPNLFAATPVFLGERDLRTMLRTVEAIEAVAQLPAYRSAVMERSATPPLGEAQRTRGLFMGYDFHIAYEGSAQAPSGSAQAGPKLIEVNTNAGGAFLVHHLESTSLIRDLQCSDAANSEALEPPAEGPAVASTERSASSPLPFRAFEQALPEMIAAEWKLAGREGLPATIAIVDTDPAGEYLYPDMLLAREMFEQLGIRSVVAPVGALAYDGEQLRCDGLAIDLVYNRLTDFDLSEAGHAALRDALEDDAVVVSPSPAHHALYADKRNLVLFRDREALRSWGLAEPHVAALASVPRTVFVTPENADELWAARRTLFFKPAAGFGGRATYRGAKLTRGVWKQILAASGDGAYLAQEFVAPSLRGLRESDVPVELKYDLRVYCYAGRPLMLAARVYQGQTTNFRTAGGGFAPVLCFPSGRAAGA